MEMFLLTLAVPLDSAETVAYLFSTSLHYLLRYGVDLVMKP